MKINNYENSCVLLELEFNWKKRKILRNLFRCKSWIKIWEIDLDDCEITEREYKKRRKKLWDFLIASKNWKFYDWYDSYDYLKEWAKRKQRNHMLYCLHSCDPNTEMIFNKWTNSLEFFSIKEMKEFEIITIDFWKNWTAFWQEDEEIPFYEEWIDNNRWVINYYWEEDTYYSLKVEDWVLKNISMNYIPMWTVIWTVCWREMKNKKERLEFSRKRKFIGWWNIKFIEYTRWKTVMYVDYMNNKFNFIEEVDNVKDANISIRRNKENWNLELITKKDIFHWENIKANFVSYK